jgi:hypothetical protein
MHISIGRVARLHPTKIATHSQLITKTTIRTLLLILAGVGFRTLKVLHPPPIGTISLLQPLYYKLNTHILQIWVHHLNSPKLCINQTLLVQITPYYFYSCILAPLLPRYTPNLRFHLTPPLYFPNPTSSIDTIQHQISTPIPHLTTMQYV